MEKLLSIIIPTYNMEAYLDRCLSSLIIKNEQLRNSVEALVVIDGAKDRSSQIAHCYERENPELFRVIDKENGNYGSCVNRGLKEATGKYVKVLDADDSFNTSEFERYLDIIKSVDVDLIVTSGINVSTNDVVTFQWRFNYESNRTYPIESLKHVWIHDVTHKTSLLRAINYRQTEGISYSDEEWVFFPMFYVQNFLALDVKLYRYTVGRDGQTMDPKKWEKSIGHEILVSKRMFDYLIKLNWDAGRASNYIRLKMSDRMQGFYSRALLTCHLYGNKELIDFDMYLSNHCHNIYESLNDVTAPADRLSFHYIRYWRRKNYQVNGLVNRFALYQVYTFLKSLKK